MQHKTKLIITVSHSVLLLKMLRSSEQAIKTIFDSTNIGQISKVNIESSDKYIYFTGFPKISDTVDLHIQLTRPLMGQE
ncbi:unnamed protein product [Schistosoma guineensis]|nr:unnamed protein product [Schistosoma guineensis]